MQPIRVKTVQESDLRMLGNLARNIQRVLPVTQADIDAAAALGEGWVVWKVFEVAEPLDNMRGGTQLIIRQNSIQPGQNVRRVIFVAGPGGQTVVIRGTDYIVLPDAIADSLAYLKAFGGTEQRNLPSGYTQLEYIESTGTQYIDTGIKPKTSLSVKIKYNVLQLTSNNNIAIFGSIANQTGLFSGAAGSPLLYYINSGTFPLPDIPFALNTICEEEYINDTMIRNGVTYTTNPIVENNVSVTLFGRNAGSEVVRIGTLRIYYFAFYDNGVLVRNFIPAKRNSDNVLGMYDTVSQTFFTNAGTGTFIAGAPVDPVLPDNYIRRDFIYMLDGSYLLTDIVPTYDCKVEMDFATTSLPSTSITFIGGRSGDSIGNGLQLAKPANGNFIIDAFDSTRYVSNVAPASNTRYKFTFNNQVAALESAGSALFTNTFTGTGATGGAIAINALNTNGAITGNAAGIYLYSFKAWNAQGELVANYVPAVQRGTVPVVGFYDTVSETFKGPTAGTFAAGPEHIYNVTPTPDNPIDIWCNNGVVKANTNLYWTEYNDYQLSQVDGITVTENSGVNVSGMVDCRTIKSFKITTISPLGTFRIFKYRADNTFINASSTANIGDIITLADNVGFFRIQYNYTNSGTGTQNILIYNSAYDLNGIYTDGTVETINVHGKNLFDVNNVDIQASTAISADGSLVTNSSVDTCITFIPVKPNTTYTISGDVLGTNTTFFRVAQYKADQTFISRSEDSTGGRLSYTFTTGAETHYIRFHYVATADISTYQLERGSTATDYVPYFDGGTATAEMLLKVGDYEDVQEILSGAITRSVGVKVLDGKENWTAFNGGVYFALGDGSGLPATDVAYCPHFSYAGSGTLIANLPMGGFTIATNGNCSFKSSDTTTKANWVAWLAAQYAAGTPVIVVYPLATPTTESVAGQTMQVQQGDNIVEITQAAINGLEIEAKYQAAVSLTIQEAQDANLDNNVEVTIS